MSEATLMQLRRACRVEAGSPKYLQLRDILLHGIERGVWGPGAKLPTEAALTRGSPYSLGTVQRALRALVEQGVVVRQQGSGTFVAHRPRAMEDPLHCRFLGDDSFTPLPIYTKVLSRKMIAERGPWSVFLGQKKTNIIRINRIIDVDREFAIYSKFYVNADRFVGIMRKPLAELDSANLKYVLGHEFHTPIAKVSQTLEVAPLPPEACRALRSKHSLIGTRIEIRARSVRDEPLYFLELFVPPNRRKLVLSESSPVPNNR